MLCHNSDSKECHNLDLSYNTLDEPEIISVLSVMVSLHVLNLIGNPILRKTVDYRRNLLHRCVDITYLDSRPVTEKDRKCLAAWARGGMEAEREERERLVREEHDRVHQSKSVSIVVVVSTCFTCSS